MPERPGDVLTQAKPPSAALSRVFDLAHPAGQWIRAEAHRLRSKECQRSPPLLHWADVESVRETGTHTSGQVFALCLPGRPWIVDVTVEFTDERPAENFERNLKSGSGVAFNHANYTDRS